MKLEMTSRRVFVVSLKALNGMVGLDRLINLIYYEAANVVYTS